MPPFFIVGVQRSGTTLVRLLLNAHSEIAVPEEARFLTPLLGRAGVQDPLKGEQLRRTVKYLSASEQLRLWECDVSGVLAGLEDKGTVRLAELIAALFETYAISEGKSLWGDKSLLFSSIERLAKLFPEARFIHVLRDGRDVFSSWRRLDRSKDHPAVMALDWKYKLRRIEKSLAGLREDRVHRVRYEDLLVDPREKIQSVCEFLGVDYEEGMLDFHKTSHRYIGTHHSRLIFSPINEANKEKWRSALNRKELLAFEACAGNYLEKFGYQRSESASPPAAYVVCVLDLLWGLPRRLGQVVIARLDYWWALRSGRPLKYVAVGASPRGRTPAKPEKEPQAP